MKVPVVYGPCMQALTPLQRNFVLAMAADPWGTATDWAKAAGYSDVKDGAKVRAHELMHNPKIEVASKEVARATMHSLGPVLATAGLIRLAQKKDHRDHFKALEALADRVGLHRQTEHVVAVQHTDLRGDALIERVRRAAAIIGIDAAKLLGENVIASEPKLIEHEPAQD